MKTTMNLEAAYSVLRGSDVNHSNDRKAPDAHAIDFTQKTLRKGGKSFRSIRPSYGISDRMRIRLTRLADSVNYIDGMPHFHFSL